MDQEIKLRLQSIMDGHSLESLLTKQVSEYTYELENPTTKEKWQIVLLGNNYKRFIETIDGWKFIEKGILEQA